MMKIIRKINSRTSFIYCILFLFVSFGACKGGEKFARSKSGVIRRGEQIVQGTPAPNIELKAIDNQKKSLSDFRGKYVLLNFWATWCAPCIAEMSALERTYKKFRGKGLEVVTVSCDPPDSVEEVKKLIKEKGLSFTVLRDPEIETPSLYGVTGFPETFFIDPEGKLLAFNDPSSGEKLVRIIADRPWDAPAYEREINSLLSVKLIPENS